MNAVRYAAVWQEFITVALSTQTAEGVLAHVTGASTGTICTILVQVNRSDMQQYAVFFS